MHGDGSGSGCIAAGRVREAALVRGRAPPPEVAQGFDCSMYHSQQALSAQC